EKELTPTTLNYDELDDLIDEYSASSSQEEASEEEVNKGEEISGELIIKNFPNLEEVMVSAYKNKEKLTKLEIINCPRLTCLYCDHNQLTSLSMDNSVSLEMLTCTNNQLTSLDILCCSNNRLTQLDIRYLDNINEVDEDCGDIDCSNNLLTRIQLPLKS
ncbi:3502_t:CDS:2, partial [Racocetra persica]